MVKVKVGDIAGSGAMAIIALSPTQLIAECAIIVETVRGQKGMPFATSSSTQG